MTVEEVARLAPRLYHVTRPDAVDRIRVEGLRSAEEALRAVDLAHELTVRRARAVTLNDGTVLSDNQPLSEAKLLRCLEDGLTPADWLRLINARVFFWVNMDRAQRLRAAKTKRHEPHAVMVFDTRRLLTPLFDRVDISPINTGSTIHMAARRGLATFAPAHATDYSSWRRQRGLKGLDRIVEVSVRGCVPAAFSALVEVLP